MDPEDRSKYVSIVVLTYRRNDDLVELLPLLEEQLSRAPVDGEVLVVDNDPDGAARGLTRHNAWPGSARYVHEPAAGIAHARNRALDETRSSDLIIFIDDDERPSPGWLVELLRTFDEFHPAAVTGPVEPDYAGTPDPWILAGGFFVRRHYGQGAILPAAGTGNLLLDRAPVDQHGLRFDERFGLTGGSDHVFTRALVARGGEIRWAARAVVTDKVPVHRATRAWVLRRAFRIGNTWSRATLVLADGAAHRLASRFRLSAIGCARVGVGIVQLVAGLLTWSMRLRARGCRMAARGLGMLMGAWGVILREYQRA